MAGHIYLLVLMGSFAFIAVGLGRLLLVRTALPFVSKGEMAFLCFGAGLGTFSLSVIPVCALGMLSRVSVLALSGVLGVLGVVGWFSAGGIVSQEDPFAHKKSAWHFLDSWAAIILGVSLCLGLLLVLTPATGKDALIYHLTVPKVFLNHRGFYFLEGNIFFHYPLGQEMLYVLALVLKGDIFAKGLHFLMALALLFGMWQLGKNVISQKTFLPLALLIFYTIPSVFTVSHMAYNDLAVSLYLILALYTYIKWFHLKKNVVLILCGGFVGLALGTKYTALFFPFIAILGILWGIRYHQGTWRDAIISMTFFLIPALVIGSPFYLKNWIMTGNPFYPFLYDLWGGKGLDPEQARLYDLFVRDLGMGRRWLDYLLLPWNVSFRAKMSSSVFDGMVGPVFLLILPFVVGIRKKGVEVKILLSCSMLIFFFWASSAQQIRYLTPIFPLLALVVCYILNGYRHKKILFIALATTITGCIGFNGYHLVKEFQRIEPLPVVIGRESKEAFLQREIPLYEMYQAVNTMLPVDARVFLIYMKNYGYLCDRAFYSDSMFEDYTLKKILTNASSAKEVAGLLKNKGFTHLLYDGYHVTGEVSTLTDAGKTLFSVFLKEYTETLKVGQERYFLCRLL